MKKDLRTSQLSGSPGTTSRRSQIGEVDQPMKSGFSCQLPRGLATEFP